MIFFLNGDGTMTRQDGTRIFQGSNKVTEVQVICQFAPPTALQLSFTLPNGLTTIYKPMEYKGQFTVANKDGAEAQTGVYYWSLPITENITAELGTVGVSINVINVQDNSNRTSYTATFTVEYSALPLPPDPPPTSDEWQQILDLLSAYYAQNAEILKQNQQLIDTILGDYTDVIARLDRAESNITALQKQTENPLLGDFTYDSETGIATKYFKDGSTATIQFPTIENQIVRSEFMTIVTFQASQFVNGELAIPATVSGLRNDNTVISVEAKYGVHYKQTANSVIKGSNGFLLLRGVSTPFDGRLVIMESGGAGTVTYTGGQVLGEGEAINVEDAELAAKVLLGDYYLNTDESSPSYCNYYKCVALNLPTTIWKKEASFRGAQGPTGPAGVIPLVQYIPESYNGDLAGTLSRTITIDLDKFNRVPIVGEKFIAIINGIYDYANYSWTASGEVTGVAAANATVKLTNIQQLNAVNARVINYAGTAAPVVGDVIYSAEWLCYINDNCLVIWTFGAQTYACEGLCTSYDFNDGTIGVRILSVQDITGSLSFIQQITLTTAGWNVDTKRQTVSVANLKASNYNTYSPLTPDAGSTASDIRLTNYEAYAAAGIKAIFESDGSVVFGCSTIPTTDIVVTVHMEEQS